MGTSTLSGKSGEMLGGNLQWTSIPSRGSSNTPSRFMGAGHYASQRVMGVIGANVSHKCETSEQLHQVKREEILVKFL